MALVWVTGSSGVGKSTVCALLRERGERAVDADWEGCNHWVDRSTGRPVTDPPYPVPAGWLDHYAWRIGRPRVEALAAEARTRDVLLFGSVENEADVRDLFDAVVCLVVDDRTLRERLLARTTNAFGKHPEELVAALAWNAGAADAYRALGAAVLDGTRPAAETAAAVLAAAARVRPPGR